VGARRRCASSPEEEEEWSISVRLIAGEASPW
jgi:hypothetical protein